LVGDRTGCNHTAATSSSLKEIFRGVKTRQAGFCSVCVASNVISAHWLNPQPFAEYI